MNSQTDNAKPLTVYRYGADKGRFMGIYLIVMSACLLASPKVPMMFLLMALLLPGFPILLFVYLRNLYRESTRNRGFLELWTAGIMITLCGTLICSLVTALWLIYVQPGFFADYLRGAIATVQSSPQGAHYQEQIQLMQKALETGTVPSPMQFVLSMVWVTVFSGSMLSMGCAWLILFRARRRMFIKS